MAEKSFLMKILVLDQQPLVSEMITMIIHRIQPLAKVIAVNSFTKFYTLVKNSEGVTAVIIDPKSPNCSGFPDVENIASILPEAKLIILTDPQLQYACMTFLKKVPHQFIEKTDSILNITNTLKDLLGTVSRDFSSPSKPKIKKLSKRHKQLLGFLNNSYSNQKIAAELGLTENTIKVHFFRLYKIFGVKNRLEALHYAKINGWIASND